AGSGSFNRTQVNQSMHAETPLTGIVSAGIVLVLILVLGPVLTYLPMPAISGTLMLVGIGMIKTEEIKRLFNWRGELAVFATTLFCILFLGLQTGLVVALVLSVLLFVISASSLELITERETVSVRIRVEGHLFYASIDQLSQILKKHRHENLILDLSVVTYLDLSATEAIGKELAKRDKESTFFAVKLSSERLQNQFEIKMAGQPVQFIPNNQV
ncbi:MAG: hypothetical protein B6D71_04225, partial [gamma proteobacterium symbiont of Stewartia floridana]